ncbi:MAG: hypothetical protein AAGF11_29150 [Myxococcota bacterium]
MARAQPRVVQLSPAVDPARPFSHVYAIGRIRPFFPAIDIEKEYQQLLPSSLPGDVTTEDQRLHYVLEKHPFLAREMGWMFYVADVSTYYLIPSTPLDLDALVDSIVPKDPTATPYDVIIGAHQPTVASSLPGVGLTWTFQFSLPELVSTVSSRLRGQGVQGIPSTAQVTEIFTGMLQLANNTGDLDEHRALNYVSVNYPDVYIAQSTSLGPVSMNNGYFSGVEARRSTLGGQRSIVDVILNYKDPSNGLTSSYYVSVDVEGEFPFLVTKLQPYLER